MYSVHNMEGWTQLGRHGHIEVPQTVGQDTLRCDQVLHWVSRITRTQPKFYHRQPNPTQTSPSPKPNPKTQKFFKVHPNPKPIFYHQKFPHVHFKSILFTFFLQNKEKALRTAKISRTLITALQTEKFEIKSVQITHCNEAKEGSEQFLD